MVDANCPAETESVVVLGGGGGGNGRYITVGLDMDEDVVDAIYLADVETVVCCVQGAMVEGNQVDTLGCASTVAK